MRNSLFQSRSRLYPRACSSVWRRDCTPSVSDNHDHPPASLRSFQEPQMEWNFFFFLRFYLFIHERYIERERRRHRQREKQAPCREPDVGLDPGSPGSCPGPKAALNHGATQAAPGVELLCGFQCPAAREGKPKDGITSIFTEQIFMEHLLCSRHSCSLSEHTLEHWPTIAPLLELVLRQGSRCRKHTE